MYRSLKHDIMPRAPLSVWVATLTLSLFGLALPLVLLQVFDRIIPFEAHETLYVLLTGLVVVVVFEFVQKMLRAAILGRQANAHAKRLYASILDHLLNAEGGSESVSKTQCRIYLEAPTRVRDHIAGTGRLFAVELPFSALALGLIWLLAGPLVLAPVIGFTALFTFACLVRISQRRDLENRHAADERRYGLFSQMIEHIGVVKANQLEIGLETRFRREQAAATSATRKSLFASNLFQSLAQTIGHVFSAAVVLTGASMVIAGNIGAAELAACTMLNGRAVQPLMSAIKHWASGESFSQTRQAVQEALTLEPRPELVEQLDPQEPGAPKVIFDDVTLRASATGRAVLRNFTYKALDGLIVFDAGSAGNARMAFRGLLGEAKPERGAVLIEGAQAKDMRRFRGTDALVYLQDQPETFSGSLIYNIALSDDSEVIDAAYRAAAMLGLEEDANRLPNGYDTNMTESGLQFASRGFIQRINVARAITRRPSILLLDDACSAMDPQAVVTTAAALQRYSQNALVLAYDSAGRLDRFANDIVEISAPRKAKRKLAARRRPILDRDDDYYEENIFADLEASAA